MLNSVRTEFDKFESVLKSAQQRINQANAELDKLVGVRTRAMPEESSATSAISVSWEAKNGLKSRAVSPDSSAVPTGENAVLYGEGPERSDMT